MHRITGSRPVTEIVARLDGAALMTIRSEKRFAIGIGENPDARSTVVGDGFAKPPLDRPAAPKIPFLQRQRKSHPRRNSLSPSSGADLVEKPHPRRQPLADRRRRRQHRAASRQSNLIGLAMASVTAFRRRRAWIAILVMASAVLLSATGVMSIGIAAFIGVGIVL